MLDHLRLLYFHDILNEINLAYIWWTKMLKKRYCPVIGPIKKKEIPSLFFIDGTVVTLSIRA
ncbi:hypothetical protein CR513_35112, partial [Mucuna pruriens]